MMIFRVFGIHDFIEKRVFQIHVFSLLSVRVGGKPRHEPLHTGARGRFGVSVTSLDKRRTDDRHQDDARAERERAAVAAQKVQPAGDRHLEGNHRAGVAHVTYDLGNERGNTTGSAALLTWIQEVCASERRLEAHPHIDLRITCCDDQAQLEHIAKSRSRRNRARRRRALRGPSSSARKAGSAKPTKAIPRRCCFRGIKKRGRGNPDLVSLALRATS